MKIEKIRTIKNGDTGRIESAYVYYRVDKNTINGVSVKCGSVKEARQQAKIKYPEIFN